MIDFPYQSKRERFSGLLGLTAFFGTLLGLCLLFTGRIVPGILAFLLGLFFLKTAVGWFFNLKRYFEFEPEIGLVNQVTVNGKDKKVVKIATSDEIQAFAVAGMRNWSKTGRLGGGSFWTYSIVMVLKNGKTIEITEPTAQKKHQEIGKKAKVLAEAMGCQAFVGEHQLALELKEYPGWVDISNRPWTFIDTFRYHGKGIIYALCLLLSIGLFVVGLVLTLS